jgi:hypothetical protein
MQIQIRTHIYDFRDADRALSELSAGSRGGSLVVARE